MNELNIFQRVRELRAQERKMRENIRYKVYTELVEKMIENVL